MMKSGNLISKRYEGDDSGSGGFDSAGSVEEGETKDSTLILALGNGDWSNHLIFKHVYMITEFEIIPDNSAILGDTRHTT